MGHVSSKYNNNNQETKDNEFILQTPQRCLSLIEQKSDEYMLIWLDEKSNDDTLDSLRTKTLLRQMNNDHCLFLNNSQIFLNEIEKLQDENHKILLIVSGSFAKIILSKTQENISTIIIFCKNYNKYRQLADKYSNVTDVCTDHETLKSSIQREIPSLKFNLFINQNFQLIRTLHSSNDILENNSAYFSYILFIELLKQMQKTEQAKKIMLDKCKDYYRYDKKELEKIESFRSNYNSELAVYWYSQDSFVYRLINQAFRTEDVALWYLFRFFIVDLCIQLEKIHKEQNIQSSMTLYRGQAHLPIKEFENLILNIGGLIATNGFLSTRRQIEVAQQFIGNAEDNDEFKVVIFEIIVDASKLKNTVFIDVNTYIRIEGNEENEILFNIGSIFKTQNVEYDIDLKVWKIQMHATDEGTDKIKQRVDIMRKKFEKGSINLLFGRLLLNMNQYAKVESYFKKLLLVLPKYHEDLASIYVHLGDLNMRITNWNEAYRNFRLAYDIKKENFRQNNANFGVILNGIGNYYRAIGNLTEAYNYYLRALEYSNDQYNILVTRLNITTIQIMNDQFKNILDECIEVRDNLQQIEPCPQVEIICCQGIIGDIYLAEKNYESAEAFYLQAFELSKQFLSTNDRYRMKSIKAFINLYQKQGNDQQAIKFCLEELSLYQTHLGEDHTNVAYLLMMLGELYNINDYQKLESFKKALHILEKNVHHEYDMTSNCLIMLANCYVYQRDYERASTYYFRALEIQNKIYPVNHTKMIETQKLIESIENNSN